MEIGMFVLNGSQTHWTKEMEDLFEKEGERRKRTIERFKWCVWQWVGTLGGNFEFLSLLLSSDLMFLFLHFPFYLFLPSLTSVMITAISAVGSHSNAHTLTLSYTPSPHTLSLSLTHTHTHTHTHPKPTPTSPLITHSHSRPHTHTHMYPRLSRSPQNAGPPNHPTDRDDRASQRIPLWRGPCNCRGSDCHRRSCKGEWEWCIFHAVHIVLLFFLYYF